MILENIYTWMNKIVIHSRTKIWQYNIENSRSISDIIWSRIQQNSIIAKFWCRSGENQRGMHWFNWNKSGRSKKEGSMGFWDIEKFNLALLGKQVWKVLQKQNWFMARILKESTLKLRISSNATHPQRGSYVWKMHGLILGFLYIPRDHQDQNMAI